MPWIQRTIRLKPRSRGFHNQKMYFIATWKTLAGAVVADGAVASAVMMPNVLEFKLATGLPGRKLLVRLKASNRTSSLWPSRI